MRAPRILSITPTAYCSEVRIRARSGSTIEVAVFGEGIVWKAGQWAHLHAREVREIERLVRRSIRHRRGPRTIQRGPTESLAIGAEVRR